MMFYATFCSQGFGPLAWINGKMDSDQYTGILNQFMLPAAENFFNNHNNNNSSSQWFLLHDNDPKHTSSKASEWMELNGIQNLNIPPYSPDLNPIENLLYIVKNKLQYNDEDDEDTLFEKLHHI